MSDNTTLPGTGDIIADEDIGGVKYQKMKLIDGTPGSKIPVATTIYGELKTEDDNLIQGRLIIEDLKSFSAGAEQEQKSLYDLLDPTNPDNIPIKTAPAGIESPGQAPASASLPVTLSNENILDKYIIAKPLFPGSLGANALAPIENAGWLDCSQYRSIFFQVNTAVGVTVSLTFEASNDGANAVNVTVLDLAAPSSSPIQTVSQSASTQRFFGAAIQFRYFRARISTAIVGNGGISAFTMLRMVPFATVPTATVTAAGFSGLLAVGGRSAVGVTPPEAPVTIGGVDNTVGAGVTRRFLTDIQGSIGVTTMVALSGAQAQMSNPVTVAGPVRGTIQGQYLPIRAQIDPNLPANANDTELLHQILIQLKTMNYYLKEMPWMIDKGIPFVDSADDFIACEPPESGGMVTS